MSHEGARVEDVAAHILKQCGPMTAMKLQRLCYFAYGYHLAWDGKQLFPERFQAWANGPVVCELYTVHRGRFELRDGDIDGRPGDLGDAERESIDIVLKAFAPYDAHQLAVMSHQPDGPWAHARKRAGAAPMERSSEELLDEDIEDYFGALVAADEGDACELAV